MMKATASKRLLVAIVVLLGVHQVSPAAEPVAMLPVDVQDVVVADSFWAPRMQIIRGSMIPHSWNHVKGAIQELRCVADPKAAKPEPEHRGRVKWREANLHKLIETCAYAVAQNKDPKLDAKVDELIAIIKAAQQPDGFIHAWATNREAKAWCDLGSEHNGYVQGHLYEAAVAHYRATGKKDYLEIAVKSADQAWRHFIENKNKGVPGHAEIELALVELYRATNDKKYLELAKAFIERRGTPPGSAYRQEHLPIRQQNAIEGHAVRAVFFATGVADVALVTGDKDLRDAANRLWESVTQRKLYITGSAGAVGKGEAFGSDYLLPNDGYAESCAGCGMANFAHRMLQLEADASMADELERVIYNATLHAIALDGKSFYYRNPLTGKVIKPVVEKGYAVIERDWEKGDTIGIEFEMPIVRMESHPKVAENKGKVTIQRGPIVYGLEGLDNNAKPLVTLAKDPKLTMKFDRDLLGGVMVVRGKTAEDKPFTAIPYYAFANRENSNQEVWLPQRGKTESERGWQGRLYRSWQP